MVDHPLFKIWGTYVHKYREWANVARKKRSYLWLTETEGGDKRNLIRSPISSGIITINNNI